MNKRQLMSKIIMLIIISFLLGWAFELQARGSQSNLQSNTIQGLARIAPSAFGTNSDYLLNAIQDAYVSMDPLTMFSPILEYSPCFEYPGSGMFPQYGSVGYSLGFGGPGFGMFSPYGGVGYPPGLGYCGFEMFSPYGGLGYSPGLVYPGFAMFPQYGYSPLANISRPGYWEAGKVWDEASGQKISLIMPPGRDEDYTPTDIMSQSRVGLPIPGASIRFNILGYDEIIYQPYIDPYTGIIYPAWNQRWWRNPSSGQVNDSEN